MGGNALLVLDVRDAEAIETAVETAARNFGGTHICINNASAIHLGDTRQVDAKRFDLLHQVNARAAYLRLARLRAVVDARLSPPVDLRPEGFAPHLPYCLSNFGMSIVALGLPEELRAEASPANAPWPATTIATAAVRYAFGGESATVLLECLGRPFLPDSDSGRTTCSATDRRSTDDVRGQTQDCHKSRNSDLSVCTERRGDISEHACSSRCVLSFTKLVR